MISSNCSSSKQSIYTAVMNAHIDSLTHICQTDKTIDLNEALHYCIGSDQSSKNDKHQCVKYLISQGADILSESTEDGPGYTALYLAIMIKDVYLVEYLLKLQGGLTVTKPECITPLRLALWYYQPQIVDLLIQHKADPYETYKSLNSFDFINTPDFIGITDKPIDESRKECLNILSSFDNINSSSKKQRTV
jgi:hypothetical protein